MNRRQWQVLLVGTAATLLAPGVAAKRYNPPVLVGPPVAVHSGPYAGLVSQKMIDGSIPGWAVGASLALVLLTGAVVYLSRTTGAAS